jgi:anthranilate synthase component 2
MLPKLELSHYQGDWFQQLPETLTVGRYHSWIVSREAFPADLEITAVDEQGMIMSLRHRQFDVQGVQFHPESVLTTNGKKMLENWLLAPGKRM